MRMTEQALNVFMSYVRRQRAGSQEYGEKLVREDQVEYSFESDKDKNSDPG